MFQEKGIMFMYCISPVHAGTGTAIGTIDSPIQRERHTYHPAIAGSGIKGALREYFDGIVSERTVKHQSEAASLAHQIGVLFGPRPEASSDHAGALSFSDAQIVLFPVRSLKKSFVYVTCPTALARLQRLLHLAGFSEARNWQPAEPPELQYIPLGTFADEQIILESFEFRKVPDKLNRNIAAFIAKHALPNGSDCPQFFRDKIQSDTILISDADFGHFVRHSTLVEPHVRINDESGTAEEGGLFYVENLPPETLLVSLVMASEERRPNETKGTEKTNKMAAHDIIDALCTIVNDRLVQIGGDSTTGRGQMLISITRCGKE